MSHFDTLDLINIICPTISLFCSLLICFEYAISDSEARATAYKQLIFALSLSGVGTGLADILMIWHKNKGVCLTGALFISLFDWTSCAWCGAIAHYVYEMVRRSMHRMRMGRAENDKLMIWYHIAVWGSGIVFALLPFVDGFNDDGYPRSYGFDGKWCWIAENAPNHWVFTIFYIPLWVLEVWIIYMVHTSRTELRKCSESMQRMSSEETESTDKNIKLYHTLAGYPMVLILVWMVGTIRRAWLWLFPSRNPDWLAGLHLATGGLQGFFNFLVFCRKGSIPFLPTLERLTNSIRDKGAEISSRIRCGTLALSTVSFWGINDETRTTLERLEVQIQENPINFADPATRPDTSSDVVL